MAYFITLLSYTDQGIRNIQDTTKRARAFQGAVRKFAKSKVKEIYWTLGHYDAVVVVEAPNDETMARIQLSLAANGNVRTETLRAFSRGEMDAILKGIK